MNEHRSHLNWPIDEVLSRLGWDGKERRHGAWTDVLCPFHPDRKIGNAAYNPVLNTFKCQACGMAGNSVTLVMKVTGRNEADAVEWLGEGGTHKPTPPPSRLKYLDY